MSSSLTKLSKQMLEETRKTNRSEPIHPVNSQEVHDCPVFKKIMDTVKWRRLFNQWVRLSGQMNARRESQMSPTNHE